MTSIMIVGVGGQGTLLASRIIGNVCVNSNYDVKVSEVHGMSQRGGSVVTYVKYGDKINSPIIDKGEADFILAFESLEAYRALPFLKKDGLMIVNSQEILPMPVIIGAKEYPKDIISKLQKLINVKDIKALDLAKDLGNIKVVNVILIGALAKMLNIPHDMWIEALKEEVKPKFIDLNIQAFEIGYNL